MEEAAGATLTRWARQGRLLQNFNHSSTGTVGVPPDRRFAYWNVACQKYSVEIWQRLCQEPTVPDLSPEPRAGGATAV